MMEELPMLIVVLDIVTGGPPFCIVVPGSITSPSPFGAIGNVDGPMVITGDGSGLSTVSLPPGRSISFGLEIPGFWGWVVAFAGLEDWVFAGPV